MPRKRPNPPTLPYMVLSMYEHGTPVLTVQVQSPGPVTAKKMAAKVKLADGAYPYAVAITLIEVAIALLGERSPYTVPLSDVVSELVLDGTDMKTWADRLREAAGEDFPF